MDEDDEDDEDDDEFDQFDGRITMKIWKMFFKTHEDECVC